MNEPFVVEEVVGEMDPRRIPGAVAALGEDERNLCLGQDLFILLRDESPVEDGGHSGSIDPGEVDGVGVGEDEREVVDELLRLRGEMPEHRLLGGAVAASRSEKPGEGEGEGSQSAEMSWTLSKFSQASPTRESGVYPAIR